VLRLRVLAVLLFAVLVLSAPAAADSADVVIVGAGGAGLAAAIEAHDQGAEVIVVEKMPMVGGNTLYATGGLNAAGTQPQAELGIEDSPEKHFEDTLAGGGGLNLEDLVSVMTEQAPEAVAWLTEDLGADLSDVGRLGGSSVNRTHRPTGGEPVGPHLIEVLRAAADERGIDIRVETEAVEIVGDPQGVSGIVVENDDDRYTIEAKSVVVTTGGFGADEAMFAEYDQDLEGFGTTNAPGATGDGIIMVDDIGGELIHMDQIQTHPTVHPERNIMITEAVRGNGAILVNAEGERFVDEMDTRAVVSAAILEQTGGSAFLFFDDPVRQGLGAVENYIDQGLVKKADTVSGLAEELGADPSVLEETKQAYNAAVEAGEDEQFGRDDLPAMIDEGPYYAIEIGPAVHHTMGGVRINTYAEVQSEEGSIPGLYAAGEVTGGIHGGNRLGGNALADVIVFGRIAGQQAGQF